MDKIVVGIDLGTTFSAVAYVDDQGVPQVIPNPEGGTTLPSVVMIRDDRIAVGQEALNQWALDEEHVARWVKQRMGDPDYKVQGLSAVEVSAEILKVLKRIAEDHLGETVDEAVITCPAYFNTIEIENTKRAGELAGLTVREIIKEPTAAAVHYGVERMRDGETIMVCDLGGGTYDATILKLEGKRFNPLASSGSQEHGGHNWTLDLQALVADRFREQFGDDPLNDVVAGWRLYEACEKAKRDLARLPEVAIPCQYKGRTEQITVSRSDFESATEWAIQHTVMWSQEALAKAKLSWSDVDTILPVGGSSRLRRFGEALEQASGKKPKEIGKPDLVVALGAAVLASGKVRVRRSAGGLVEAGSGGLVEVGFGRIIARNFGTRGVEFGPDGPRLKTALIIPHGTESPVERSRDDFVVASDGQGYFDVPVMEYEHEDDRQCQINYRFTCPPNAKQGDRIAVTFKYDVNGIITAEATSQKTGETLPAERVAYEEPDLEAFARVAVKPRWVVFALDASYSMGGHNKMDNAKAAVKNSARDLLALESQKTRIGVVTFASDAEICCEPTSDLSELSRKVDAVSTRGTTAMDDGINRAVELVLTAPAGLTREVVMVTDGMPDPHREDSTIQAAKTAKDMGITLSAVGIGTADVDKDYLDKLTPISLVIESAGDLERGVINVLEISEKRAGLTDAAP